MWFKHRAWVPVAWFLSVANVVSVWFAARPGETWHATAHALLAVLFGLGAQRLRLRHATTADGDVALRLEDLEARIADMQQLPDTSRLTELEERLDFAERALIDVRARANVPRKDG